MRRNTDQLTVDALKREHKHLSKELEEIERLCGFDPVKYKSTLTMMREALKAHDYEEAKRLSKIINDMDALLRNECSIRNAGEVTTLRCEIDDLETLINMMTAKAA